MTVARRLTTLVVAVLLLCAVGYGAGFALRSPDSPASAGAGAGSGSGAADVAAPPTQEPVRTPERPATPAPTPRPEPVPEPRPTPKPAPTPAPEPVLQPGPRLLGPGDDSDEVKGLQARLRQIDWFEADVTGYYGEVTETAVRGFQAKREIPVTGEVDQRTMDRLLAMTSEPTTAELTNQVASSAGNVPGALDERCRTGRVLCIDKTSRTLRWLVDGQVERTVDVRFGSTSTPTREGVFHVDSKSRDHVSTLYDSSMPFAMFFSGGQAVHYSSDFAATGYSGASHGCVNVRDYDAVAWLFDQVAVGDTVVVYWS